MIFFFFGWQHILPYCSNDPNYYLWDILWVFHNWDKSVLMPLDPILDTASLPTENEGRLLGNLIKHMQHVSEDIVH